MMLQLKDLQIRETDLSERVESHKEKEDEFFNVRVKQITTRHAREMSELEDMVRTSFDVG